MMKKIWKNRSDEEGEMGVGTLLIFIAMILVAAVAASVLVTTAYKLQQQAEATGNEALADIATGVKVIAIWGVTNGASSPQITDIYFKIVLTAGSPGINLRDMKMEVIQTIGGAIGAEKTLDRGTATSSSEFALSELRDMAPTTTVDMMTSGDVFQVHVNMTQVGMPLDVQEQISVLFMPKHGVPTYMTVTAPSTLEASSVVVMK